jgi:stress responsive alpha/beta barrel protein
MIKHIVLWTLKNRENPQSHEETAAAIKAKIEGMRGRIPGLLHIEGGIDFMKSADSWDIALYAELESREALAGYHVHPAHEEFKAFIGPRRQQRSLIDYEV